MKRILVFLAIVAVSETAFCRQGILPVIQEGTLKTGFSKQEVQSTVVAAGKVDSRTGFYIVFPQIGSERQLEELKSDASAGNLDAQVALGEIFRVVAGMNPERTAAHFVIYLPI